MNTFLLSIITPVYNRADLLKECYKSLCAQTDYSFEWIIVDDGSTDKTEETALSFTGNDLFCVKYLKKENGGKHTALNYAHPYINGNYVLMLDSDDTLTAQAVEKVKAGCSFYDENDQIGMLIWLKGKSEDSPNCYVKEENKIVDFRNYPRIICESLDCCEVIRSSLFLAYPFPVFPNERFISEGALWNRAAQVSKCVYFNEVIYLCYYHEGGLTKSGKPLRIRNPYGGMYTSFLRMDKHQRIKERVKAAILYDCYGYFTGRKASGIMNYEKGHSFMKLMFMLPGYLLYKNWDNKYGDTK